MFPRTRNRLKDRDKVKSLFRRSISLSSLVYPSAPLEVKCCPDSSVQLEESEADVEESRKDPLTSSLTISISSTLPLPHTTTLPSGHLNSTTTDIVPDVSKLWVTDKDSNDSNLPSGPEDSDELQNHGLNCAKSRAQSESSVEFNLSLENEPWSNGSSPVQQPPSRRSSSSSYQAPSDTSTPQHTKQQHKEKTCTMTSANSQILDAQCEPKQRDPVLSQDFWLRRGTKSIRRGPRGKVIRRASDSGGTSKSNPGLNGMNTKLSTSKAETTRASACSPITVLYVQGKSSSMSGCLNCFSSPLGKEGMRLKGPWSPKSLPRASSVISTAEGSSRRSSVSSDYKVIVKTDPLPVQVSEYSKSNIQEEIVIQNQQPETDIKNSESEPIPPVKPPRDPAAVAPTDCPKSSVQESLFDSSFTFKSVFSNTIFSDSVVTATTTLDGLDSNQTILCPNPPLDQNCSLETSKSVENTPQPVLNMANEQGQNREHPAGLEGKDEQLAIA